MNSSPSINSSQLFWGSEIRQNTTIPSQILLVNEHSKTDDSCFQCVFLRHTGSLPSVGPLQKLIFDCLPSSKCMFEKCKLELDQSPPHHFIFLGPQFLPSGCMGELTWFRSRPNDCLHPLVQPGLICFESLLSYLIASSSYYPPLHQTCSSLVKNPLRMPGNFWFLLLTSVLVCKSTFLWTNILGPMLPKESLYR